MVAAPRRLAPGAVLLVLGGAAVATCSFVVGAIEARHVSSRHPAISDPGDVASTDVEFIVSEAQKVQQADVKAWTRYRFQRLVRREDFDEAGRVIDHLEMEFLVTPGVDGFREELVHLDGREPSREDKEEQRPGGFSKHYKTLTEGAGGDAEEGGYSLGLLLHLSSYRFAGREERDGVACYRLDFAPGRPRGGRRGVAERIADAMAGSLWITVEGFHLASARAATTHPISIALSLSKVYDVKVSLESGAVGEGVWLPRHLELQTRARVLIKAIRRRQTYVYSDFHLVGVPASK